MIIAAGMLALALLGATPNPSPTASQTPTADDILARMVAARKGLDSYTVPVHYDVKMRKPLGVVLHINGVQYFQNPDKQALDMKSVPQAGKAFQQMTASLGTAETWLHTNAVTLVAPDQAWSVPVYELRGVPQGGSDVDHIVVDVAQDDLTPLRVRWFYRNGATIDMTIESAMVNGQYLLPKTETLDLSFPSFAGHAVGHYADYSINQPIPASVWGQKPSGS